MQSSSIVTQKNTDDDDERVTVPTYMKAILNVEFPENSAEDEDDSDFDGSNCVSNVDYSSLSENSGNELEASGIINQLENNIIELEQLNSNKDLTEGVTLARQRKVKSIRPTNKNKRPCTLQKQSHYWIGIRIEEFPNNSLSEVANKLYCKCCTKFIKLKKDTVTCHIEGTRHQQFLVKYNKKQQMQQTLHKYVNDNLQVAGCKAEELVYRIEVCRVFLINALPFHLLEDTKMVRCGKF